MFFLTLLQRGNTVDYIKYYDNVISSLKGPTAAYTKTKEYKYRIKLMSNNLRDVVERSASIQERELSETETLPRFTPQEYDQAAKEGKIREGQLIEVTKNGVPHKVIHIRYDIITKRGDLFKVGAVEDEQEEQDDSPVTIPIDAELQNVADISAEPPPFPEDQTVISTEVTDSIMSPVGSDDLFSKTKTIVKSSSNPISKSVYEIGKEYSKVKAEKAELSEKLGGEDKIEQLQEEAIETMIKELDDSKTVNGKPAPWMALFNDTTNGHGTRFALNLMSTVSKYTPVAQAKTTDFIAATINSIQETDEFMEEKLGFGLAPKVVEDSVASFLFKSSYGFENDKNANEYATQIMKLLGETAVLSESVLGIASAPVKIGTALRNPLGDIITAKDIGFEKGKLIPSLKAADEKKLTKEIQALVKNTQKQIKKEVELSNEFRKNSRMFSPKITDISVANARRVNNDFLDKIEEANKKIVDENPNIAENAIFAIEDGLAHNSRITEKYVKAGKTLLEARKDDKWLKIHYIDDKGNMRYDPDLAREVGRKTTVDLDENVRLSRTVLGFGKVTMEGSELGKASAVLRTDMDSAFTQPVLVPEKFDALVALASNLSKKYPQKFRSKNVIDDLYKMAADPNVEIEGTEIVAELNKVGLSFEDYIMTVVGSGSEAGKVLQKLHYKKPKNLNKPIFYTMLLDALKMFVEVV